MCFCWKATFHTFYSGLAAVHSALFRIRPSLLFQMWYLYVGFRSLQQKKLHKQRHGESNTFALLSCHFLFPVHYTPFLTIWEISYKVKKGLYCEYIHCFLGLSRSFSIILGLFQSFSVIDVHENPQKIQNLQYFYHLRITPFKKSFLC